jgi:serine/threonine protein kinase
MSYPLPPPVQGYAARQYLGAGAWKVAFRANANGINDVALLMFRDPKRAAMIAADVTAAIELCNGHEYSSYLADFYCAIRDGDAFYLVEELLVRSLSHEAPLPDVHKWTNYARDLCRALTCIHDSYQVHRDVKLDNCGISKAGRAKIFDLGSLTTEIGGKVEGTILTRAPELLKGARKYTYAADIWALGATLYALRTGRYPFVMPNEIDIRRKINEKMGTGKISEAEANKQKRDIDLAIAKRAKRPTAEAELQEEIRRDFSPLVCEHLIQMLSFDVKIRKTARDWAETWSELSAHLGGTGPSPILSNTKWGQIRKMLSSVLVGEIPYTMRMYQRLAAEWEADRAALLKEHRMTDEEIGDLEAILCRVKDLIDAPIAVR